jgi:hypothetical protein
VLGARPRLAVYARCRSHRYARALAALAYTSRLCYSEACFPACWGVVHAVTSRPFRVPRGPRGSALQHWFYRNGPMIRYNRLFLASGLPIVARRSRLRKQSLKVIPSLRSGSLGLRASVHLASPCVTIVDPSQDYEQKGGQRESYDVCVRERVRVRVKVPRKEKYMAKVRDRDARIIEAISGQRVFNARMGIEDGYFERERTENLREQGYEVVDFGFKSKERVYGGAKEYAIRKADKDMEICEAKRVNDNPFDDSHYSELDKEDRMEDRKEVVNYKTTLLFVERQIADLCEAKIERVLRKYEDKVKDTKSESITFEVWNDDMASRFILKIGSKAPIIHSYPVTEESVQPVIRVAKGSFSATRNEEKTEVTVVIKGKKKLEMKFTTTGIWMAMVVDKKEQEAKEINI